MQFALPNEKRNKESIPDNPDTSNPEPVRENQEFRETKLTSGTRTAMTELLRLLIIDDLFGRTLQGRRNEDRSNLCGQYLLEDITGDEVGTGTAQKIKRPIAQAIFCRGQTPSSAVVGDTIRNDVQGTLQKIRDGWTGRSRREPCWALVLLDLCFRTGRVTADSDRSVPGMPEGRDGDDDPARYFGLQVLRAIHDEFPDLPVVILSSQPREEVSREFSRLGALAFLAREAENSPDLLREYMRRYGLVPDSSRGLVGRSKALLLALRTARVASANRQNVLIRGERGVGKELLARYIHAQGDPNTPFVEVNSPALTPELYPAELYGIEANTATGVAARPGRILQANRGDLFFDEIKDMLPQVQAGVLKVLEERQFTQVGGRKTQTVDVRFLSATNADIEALAATDKFRSDLLGRLRQGGTIVLPPLRDRKEDIPLLVESFLRQAEAQHPRALKREVDPDALEKLCQYDWPGNIRELRDCIFSAVNHHPDLEHLVPVHIRFEQNQRASLSTEAPATSSPEAKTSLNGLVQCMTGFDFAGLRQPDLAGMLQRLQEACARLLAAYLKAILDTTAEMSKGEDGSWQTEIVITRAMKLATGDDGLSTSKAADLIKRLLRIYPGVIRELLADPILKKAQEIAVDVRPRQKKSRTIQKS